MSRFAMTRLEVFSMWFDDKNSGNLSLNIVREKKNSDSNCRENFKEFGNKSKLDSEQEPGSSFKGRIFILGLRTFHDMYDSRKVDSLYSDYPRKSGFKRKRADSNDEVEDLVGLKNNSEGDGGDSISGHNNLLPWSQNEESKQYLPLMGPNEGIFAFTPFQVVVHRDSGNPETEKNYVDFATSGRYFKNQEVHSDIVSDWLEVPCKQYNESFILEVPCRDFRSLKLDSIVYDDSKVVHVLARFVMVGNNAAATDIYICGKLAVAVATGVSVDKESVLFQTPTNKALKVSLGQFITLLRSVVAVPYESDFKVKAKLHRPDNADDTAFFPIVDDDAYFDYIDCDADPEFVDVSELSEFFPPTYVDKFPARHLPNLFKFKKDIRCSGGCKIEVTVIVDGK